MSDSDSSPNVIEVLQSVLLPGSELLWAFAEEIKGEATEREWGRSLNRVEGFAVLSLVFGIPIPTAYFIYSQSIIKAIVDLLGLPSLIGLTIATVLIYLKLVVLIIGKIDQGEAVLVSVNDNAPVWSAVILGGTFLTASIGMVFALNMSFQQFLVFMIISLVVIASFVAGVTCLAKIAILHRA